jgi:queuosine biosynthesis protein QueC
VGNTGPAITQIEEAKKVCNRCIVKDACLAWALEHFERVETLGFHYGQRHRIELDCRAPILDELRSRFPQWASRLGEDHLLDLAVLGQISSTALTDERAIAFESNGLPNTFVPGRNLIFFNFAAALAYRRGLKVLVGGMCETDYSGYPDCRDDTLKALQATLSLGMDTRFRIETPLMWLDKARCLDIEIRTPPLRPGTRWGFGIFEYAGRMTISFRYDATAITPAAADAIMNCYLTQWRELLASARSEQLRDPVIAAR